MVALVCCTLFSGGSKAQCVVSVYAVVGLIDSDSPLNSSRWFSRGPCWREPFAGT